MIGVDLAAEPSKTALALVEWSGTAAIVRALEVGVGDDALLGALAAADKAGIDCPLGWPASFATFVAQHHRGAIADVALAQDKEGRRRLLWRRTDEDVRERTGLIPLSVAADRIAHVAVRCATLQARLAELGRPVDRTGAGILVEVYPAGSLRAWGLPDRRYKGAAGAAALHANVDVLLKLAPWLDLGIFDPLCRSRDDSFDAVIAALTARAAALGLTTAPPQPYVDQARTEGWIALPTSPLHELAPQQG